MFAALDRIGALLALQSEYLNRGRSRGWRAVRVRWRVEVDGVVIRNFESASGNFVIAAEAVRVGWRFVVFEWLSERRSIAVSGLASWGIIALRWRCSVVLRELGTFSAVVDDVDVAELLLVAVGAGRA